jgi:hypothetical protein
MQPQRQIPEGKEGAEGRNKVNLHESRKNNTCAQSLPPPCVVLPTSTTARMGVSIPATLPRQRHSHRQAIPTCGDNIMSSVSNIFEAVLLISVLPRLCRCTPMLLFPPCSCRTLRALSALATLAPLLRIEGGCEAGGKEGRRRADWGPRAEVRGVKGWLGVGVKEGWGRRDGAGVAWTAVRKLRRCIVTSASSCKENMDGSGIQKLSDSAVTYGVCLCSCRLAPCKQKPGRTATLLLHCAADIFRKMPAKMTA